MGSHECPSGERGWGSMGGEVHGLHAGVHFFCFLQYFRIGTIAPDLYYYISSNLIGHM